MPHAIHARKLYRMGGKIARDNSVEFIVFSLYSDTRITKTAIPGRVHIRWSLSRFLPKIVLHRISEYPGTDLNKCCRITRQYLPSSSKHPPFLSCVSVCVILRNGYVLSEQVSFSFFPAVSKIFYFKFNDRLEREALDTSIGYILQAFPKLLHQFCIKKGLPPNSRKCSTVRP